MMELLKGLVQPVDGSAAGAGGVGAGTASGDGAKVLPFAFEGAAVRVVMRDGEPWFVLADVCGVLGIGNASQVAARLDDDEKATLRRASGDTLPANEGVADLRVRVSAAGLVKLAKLMPGRMLLVEDAG